MSKTVDAPAKAEEKAAAAPPAEELHSSGQTFMTRGVPCSISSANYTFFNLLAFYSFKESDGEWRVRAVVHRLQWEKVSS